MRNCWLLAVPAFVGSGTTWTASKTARGCGGLPRADVRSGHAKPSCASVGRCQHRFAESHLAPLFHTSRKHRNSGGPHGTCVRRLRAGRRVARRAGARVEVSHNPGFARANREVQACAPAMDDGTNTLFRPRDIDTRRPWKRRPLAATDTARANPPVPWGPEWEQVPPSPCRGGTGTGLHWHSSVSVPKRIIKEIAIPESRRRDEGARWSPP